MIEVSEEVKRALYDVTANYTLLSYDQFLDNSQFTSWEVSIPILSINQLSENDFKWIEKELPDVIDFLTDDKPNKIVCCYFSIESSRLSDDLDLVTFKLKSFYERIKSGFKEIIIACIIEEILTGKIPVIRLGRISSYEYFPVHKINTSLYVTPSGVRMHIIGGAYERDTIRKYFDPYSLAVNHLFQYHQRILASLVGGDI